MKALRFIFIAMVLFVLKGISQAVIRIEDISKHIGDSVKICTKIYGGRFLNRLKDRPTYLEVGADYPDNPLTIVIWEKDRENFDDRPEMMYAHKKVCVTGKLTLDKGKSQMVVTKSVQIILQE